MRNYDTDMQFTVFTHCHLLVYFLKQICVFIININVYDSIHFIVTLFAYDLFLLYLILLTPRKLCYLFAFDAYNSHGRYIVYAGYLKLAPHFINIEWSFFSLHKFTDTVSRTKLMPGHFFPLISNSKVKAKKQRILIATRAFAFNSKWCFFL